MHVLKRSKSQKMRKQEKNPEEDEEAIKKARYLQKLKAKSTLIRAEFEKHKKKLLLSVSETSKANEAKLRFQLDELFAINQKKRQDLDRLKASREKIEHEKQDINNFNTTLRKFETRSPQENINVSMDYQSNRTSYYMVSKEDDPKILGEKLAELNETWGNVDRLSKFEEEVEAAVKNRLEELIKDNHMLTRNVNELRKLNDHFDKRFNHLKEVEFAARSKYAETVLDLGELKNLTKDLRNREKAFKKEKHNYKENEELALAEKQNEMAAVLVALENKKIEKEQTTEELKKVTLKYEEMVQKKKSTKAIAEFAELIEHLCDFFFNTGSTRNTGNIFVKIDDKRTSSTEGEKERSEKSHSRPNSLNLDRTISKSKESTIDRDYYLSKIQQFYERHPNGPGELVARLCELYAELCFKEGSLKKMYDEFQSEKLKKKYKLNMMMNDLGFLRQGSVNFSQAGPGAEFSVGGIFIVNSQEVTMNQAKFLLDTKRETDSELTFIAAYETFILRCFLDFVEMVSRFGSMANLIADHADNIIPEDVRRLGYEIDQYVSLFRRVRNNKGSPESARDMETGRSTKSGKETDRKTSSDLNTAFPAFVAKFGGYANKATEFVNRLKQDTMVGSFIKSEDIVNYLEKYQGADVEQEIEKSLDDIPELRKKAIENMLSRLQTALKYYSELVSILQSSKQDCLNYFKTKKYKFSFDAKALENPEPSDHLKNALKKQWERMLERYDYDPNAHTKSGHSSFERVTPEQQKEQGVHKKVSIPGQTEVEIKEEEEKLDTEDLKARVKEIANQTLCKSGPRSYGDGTAFLSKTKQDEERKRLLLKAKKEKMKQVLYNMSEDEFFEWNRKQIGKGEDGLVIHQEEGQGFNLKPTNNPSKQKLNSLTPIDGVKMMIENSRMLSKLNILERHKTGPHGIKQLKYDLLGNYIPSNPIVVPRSAASSPKGKRNSILNSFAHPSTQKNKAIDYPFVKFPSSTRNSPTNALDRTGDTYQKSNVYSAMPSVVKIQGPLSPSYSQSDLRVDLDKSKRNSLVQDKPLEVSLPLTQKSIYSKSKSQKVLTKPADNPTKKHTSPKVKLNTFLKSNTGKEPKSGYLPTSTKEGVELPKLNEKIGKEKKSKQKKFSLPESFMDTNELCAYFSLQSDPMIKGVYSSTLFSTSLPGSPTAEELNFRREYLYS